eukprot:Nitzschia sp. Nitz4//scaffold15_size197535//165655//166482//NITZ4_001604-RA/size197535-processed-gene-0.98-mRNA-1//-1//CDS//3329537793//6864//frame0
MKYIWDQLTYIVAIEPRSDASGSASQNDMSCFKELSCSNEFFQGHIHDNPKNICTKCQVAGLCGMDLKIYFHQHSLPVKEDSQQAVEPASPAPRVVRHAKNEVATLLTFNPDTGRCNYSVQGKAYILLNDGRSKLSKEQVWGLQELLREVHALYLRKGDGDRSEARLEMLTWTTQYQAGTWAPRCIYEERTPRRKLGRCESGMSDQATCHHGLVHCHHHGHHDCCHQSADEWDQENDPMLGPPTKDAHHVVCAPKHHETLGDPPGNQHHYHFYDL